MCSSVNIAKNMKVILMFTCAKSHVKHKLKVDVNLYNYTKELLLAKTVHQSDERKHDVDCVQQNVKVYMVKR